MNDSRHCSLLYAHFVLNILELLATAVSLSTHLDKYGDWALVAGGAQGLGRAFSEALLSIGKNVIVIDLDAAALQEACGNWRGSYNGKIIPIELDLSDRHASDRVIQLVKEHHCRLLVYNAAYGPVRKFEKNSSIQLDQHIDLNARTLLHLCSAWVNYQGKNTSAGLLAMSSMAAVRGTLLVAPYAATKAFTWNLMESLYYEYCDTKLDFAAMCAGPIATPNYLGTEPRNSVFLPKPDTPDYVAHKALLQLGKRPVDFPGRGNRFSNFILSRILPRRWAAKLNNSVMAKTYPQFWSD